MSAILTASRALISATFTVSLFVAPLVLSQLDDFNGWQPDELMETQSASVQLAEWMLPVQQRTAPEMSVETAEVLANGTVNAETVRASTDTPALTVTRPENDSRARTNKPAPEATSKSKGRTRKCSTPSDGIEKLSPANFSVERGLIGSYATHPARLNGLGWVSKHKDNSGSADGFKLGGIKCGTDLFEAGFRNGDVVHSVNGKPIHNVAQALLAYAGLKRKNLVDVAITRKGSRKTLTYHLG